MNLQAIQRHCKSYDRLLIKGELFLGQVGNKFIKYDYGCK